LNRHVFNEDKVALITAIAKNPDRFVGIFRSTTPRLKLIQNLLQSREIRFGDAMEEIITKQLTEMGYIHLDKKLLTSGRVKLACDQHFCARDESRFYLVEHKVRDDHDSSKKEGQIRNFHKKLIHLKSLHGKALVGIMYFIDPLLHKNEGYYRTHLIALQEQLEIPIYLLYNGEFFQFLQGHTQNWEQLLNSLHVWKKTVPEQLNLDYDAQPDKTFSELRGVNSSIWFKIISNDLLWVEGFIKVLFPTGQVLQMLDTDFRQKGGMKLQAGRRRITFLELAALLQLKLGKYYSP
jgi:hypothetical protein